MAMELWVNLLEIVGGLAPLRRIESNGSLKFPTVVTKGPLNGSVQSEELLVRRRNCQYRANEGMGVAVDVEFGRILYA